MVWSTIWKSFTFYQWKSVYQLRTDGRRSWQHPSINRNEGQLLFWRPEPSNYPAEVHPRFPSRGFFETKVVRHHEESSSFVLQFRIFKEYFRPVRINIKKVSCFDIDFHLFRLYIFPVVFATERLEPFGHHVREGVGFRHCGREIVLCYPRFGPNILRLFQSIVEQLCSRSKWPS